MAGFISRKGNKDFEVFEGRGCVGWRKKDRRWEIDVKFFFDNIFLVNRIFIGF